MTSGIHSGTRAFALIMRYAHPAECAEVAGRELSAGVGLLDLRVITGDAELVKGARTALIDTLAWQRPQTPTGTACVA